MNATDQLLVTAKAASNNPGIPANRSSAASEGRSYLEIYDPDVAQGCSRAAGSLAGLMVAFHELRDPAARLALAQGIGLVVDAIRAERAAGVRQEIASRPARQHWTGDRA